MLYYCDIMCGNVECVYTCIIIICLHIYGTKMSLSDVLMAG